MLKSSNIHYKSSDLFSILREHWGKRYEFGKDKGNEHDDMRPQQSAAGRIYKACLNIQQ